MSFISKFDAKRMLQRQMVKIWQRAVLNPKLSKTHFFEERVVLLKWIQYKTHFLARNDENLAKRCFQPKIKKTHFSGKSCFS